MPIWPFGKNNSPAQPAPATESKRTVLSIISPEEARALGGFPAEAILGEVATDDKGIRRETFVPNPRFIEFLHQVIRTAGPLDEGLQAAAAAQREGWVYIIDLRTPEGPQGRVPPEDIIGGFEVRDGHILPESYWANQDHRLLTGERDHASSGVASHRMGQAIARSAEIDVRMPAPSRAEKGVSPLCSGDRIRSHPLAARSKTWFHG